MRRTLTCVLVLVSVSAMAADPGPPPPPPPPAESDLPPPPPPPPSDPAPQEACVPACRSGYACQNGQCVPSSDAPTNESAEPLPPGSAQVSDRGERAPPGQHWEYKRKVGLLITGPILFGVGYGFAILNGISGFGGGYASSRLFCFIPLVGPGITFVAQLTSNYYSAIGSAGSIILDLGFTIISTALQATGLALGLLGIPKRQVLVDDPGRRRDDDDDRRRDRDDDRPRNEKPPPIQWSIAPFAPGADVGLSLLVVH